MDDLIRVVLFLFDCPKAIYKGCFISNGSLHLLRVYSVPDTLVSGLHVFFFLTENSVYRNFQNKQI